MQKKQRIENMSLTWKNGHAVHAAGLFGAGFLRGPSCIFGAKIRRWILVARLLENYLFFL